MRVRVSSPRYQTCLIMSVELEMGFKNTIHKEEGHIFQVMILAYFILSKHLFWATFFDKMAQSGLRQHFQLMGGTMVGYGGISEHLLFWPLSQQSFLSLKSGENIIYLTIKTKYSFPFGQKLSGLWTFFLSYMYYMICLALPGRVTLLSAMTQHLPCPDWNFLSSQNPLLVRNS